MDHRFQVNRNGDTADTLLQGHIAVMDAASKLLDAIRATPPHGRNYQFDGGGAAKAKDSTAHMDVWEQAKAIREWAEQGAMRALKQKEQADANGGAA